MNEENEEYWAMVETEQLDLAYRVQAHLIQALHHVFQAGECGTGLHGNGYLEEAEDTAYIEDELIKKLFEIVKFKDEVNKGTSKSKVEKK